MRRFGFLRVLAWGLLFCLAASTTAWAKDNVVKLPDGMSITLPESWKVKPKEEGGPLLLAFGTDGSGAQPFGMVMVNQVKLKAGEEALTQDKLGKLDPKAKENFLAEMENNFRAEFGGDKSPLKIKAIIAREIRNLNGFNAASIAAELDSEGNEVILEANIIMFADRAVQFQVWCSKAQYEAHGQEVKDIVNSFVAGKN